MTEMHKETCTCVSLCLGVLPVCGGHVHLCILSVHEPVCGARVGLQAVHGTCIYLSATGTASNIPTCASPSPLDGGCPCGFAMKSRKLLLSHFSMACVPHVLRWALDTMQS